MADFMTELWSAVFVAGPTPTLLLATNATFAALQTLLLALFLTTQSIHFVVLSILCAGLWYAINWFATEIRAAQLEEEKRTQQEQDTQTGDKDREASHDQSGMNDRPITSPHSAHAAGATEEEKLRSTETLEQSLTSVSGAHMAESHGIRQRSTQMPGHNSGDLSADSDWEQIDGER